MRVARGEDIEEFSNFSKEESLFFTGGRGIESLVAERTKRLIAPSARRNRSDILSSRVSLKGASIEFRSCKIHGEFRGMFGDVFRTTISQFRRERVRVNGRTTRMILGDLRSPNRSQIAFALVFNGWCARIGSILDAYSISFDIIQMEPAPLLSYYNYPLKIVSKLSVQNILLKRVTM